ncbi:hypothetical protein [Archangium lipolyticum]|uniref:hypothetical protein n=1 Tax=Archangium lipolyticum TaxID=2970465 RepID=UPI002149CCDE|nr:hypothetical protein [Archangium lipolyticum]
MAGGVAELNKALDALPAIALNHALELLESDVKDELRKYRRDMKLKPFPALKPKK